MGAVPWMDWPPREISRRARMLFLRWPSGLPQGKAVHVLRRSLFNHYAAWMVQRGLDLLSGGRIIITDRLHGHILCCLLGKPHVVVDNSYGKVFGYIRAWSPDGITHCVSSYDDALNTARDLLGAQAGSPEG